MTETTSTTRKALVLIMLFALLAPFAAILAYFLFHKTAITIAVFLFVGLLYFPVKYLSHS